MFAMNKILLCILTFSCGLQAQIDDGSLKARLRQEILEKQRLMREGRVIRSNVRVIVRLQNGARFRGVVKGGRVIERVDGLAFVPADVASPDAGLRLWYYNNTNSYIFLPFATIKHHNIGEKLTDEEIEMIEQRIVAAKRMADQRRQMLARARQDAKVREAQVETVDQAAPAKPGGAANKTAKNDPAKPSMDPALTKLLEEFPPEDGWSEQKYQQIQKNKVVVGVYPDQKSSRFVANYEEWSRAKELAKVLKQQPAPRSIQDAGKKLKD